MAKDKTQRQRVTEAPQVVQSRSLVVQDPAKASGLLQAIITVASDQHLDVAKMERLFEMHQKVKAQEAEADFNDALARAQSRIQPVVNNALNSHTRSTYAKLAQINKEIVPIYSAEGLSLSFDTETGGTEARFGPIEQGMRRTVAILSHRAGHKRTYHIDLPPDDSGSQGTKNKTGVQAAGSTNSYARRYLALMIFNVSTEDDNDGSRTQKEERPEPDEAFVKACHEGAAKGTAALQAVWQAATKEQRKSASHLLPEFKTAAAAADQNQSAG